MVYEKKKRYMKEKTLHESMILLYDPKSELKSQTFVFLLILFGKVLWHINHCWFFNDKSSLYIYIKYI